MVKIVVRPYRNGDERGYRVADNPDEARVSALYAALGVSREDEECQVCEDEHGALALFDLTVEGYEWAEEV